LIAELTAYAFVLPTFERFLCPFLAQPRFNASQQSAILQKMHISEVQLDISNSMLFVVVIDMIGSGCSFKLMLQFSYVGLPNIFSERFGFDVCVPLSKECRTTSWHVDFI
jgi:hypothetical protein